MIGAPELPPEKAIALLRRHRENGEALLARGGISSDDHSTWVMLARNYLEKAFGQNSPNVTTVTSAGRYGSFPMNAGEAWWQNHRAETLQSQLKKIDGLIELLTTEVALQHDHVVPTPEAKHGHKIFLVHGHDALALHETARFLEKLRQEVVVLREQPNQGRTIVEKFEDYADVGFAIVLLTADDRGGPKSSDPSALQYRARQNVIFELGYFNGRLGRGRVCALYQSGVEIPSDYAGVLYVELDDRGAWRLQLAKELRAAGLSVDMNDAL
ncbi:MAG: nucleotide-binding protein [Phycisphaeraceae bacterium]|nr:nucleotide-binding protein [Phycisphaeraceae bacterium]